MKSLQLNKFSNRVYYSSPYALTDRPVLGVITGEKATLIVDAGNSEAHAQELLNQLVKINLSPARYVAITHWHWDHIFGMSRLKLPTFAHTLTQEKIKELASLSWTDEALDQRVIDGDEIAFCRDAIKLELPDRTRLTIAVPDISFSTEVTIDLGGISCIIEHVGGDHSPDCCVVYVSEEKIMFIGDCLCEDIYHGPWKWSTERLFPLMDHLLKYDVDYYIESHAEKPISRQEMVEEAQLMKIVGTLVNEMRCDEAHIATKLEEMITVPLEEEHFQMIRAFLAGLT